MDLILPSIVFLAIPLFMLFFFKSNGGILFLAACSGLVLLNSLDPAVVTTAGAVVPGEGEAYIRLAVVMLTIIFAGLVFKSTLTGSAYLMSILIVVLMSLMLWVTMPEASGVTWLVNSIDSNYWKRINDFATLIIASGLALSLVTVLLGQKREGKKGKH